MLKLSLAEYQENADAIERGLRLTARFLTREKVLDSKSLPYLTQLIPLPCICAIIDNGFDQDTIRKKLAQWFGRAFLARSTAEPTRPASHSMSLMSSPGSGAATCHARLATRRSARRGLLTIQTRLSAAYKGLMALLMKVGSHDFLSGDSIEISTYFDMNIDIHHIFPKAFCEKQKYRRALEQCRQQGPALCQVESNHRGQGPKLVPEIDRAESPDGRYPPR